MMLKHRFPGLRLATRLLVNTFGGAMRRVLFRANTIIFMQIKI